MLLVVKLLNKLPEFQESRNFNRVQKSPPIIPILSQINPIHTLSFYLINTNPFISTSSQLFPFFNIFLPKFYVHFFVHILSILSSMTSSF
jgi:hypothetical protein